MKKSKGNVSRRKFIGQASCAGIGYATLLNTMLNFKAINASAMSSSDCTGFNDGNYKALVCIMLSGGSDSYNMLIPKDSHPNTSYTEYAASRVGLKIPENDIITNGVITEKGAISLNSEYYLHPELTGIKTLFDSGKLSFVSNVGTLVDNMNYSQYQANVITKPLGLFSHSDQIQQWQTAIYDERTQYGWGGRISEMINDCSVNTSPISMNFSLGGSNIFQASPIKSEYSITSKGPVNISGYDEYSADFITQLRTQSVNNLIEHNYQDIFKDTYTNAIKDGREADEIIRAALANANSNIISTDFSNNGISQALNMIARTIEIQNSIGFKRQIFFVNFGGWDHHDDLKDNQKKCYRCNRIH